MSQSSESDSALNHKIQCVVCQCIVSRRLMIRVKKIMSKSEHIIVHLPTSEFRCTDHRSYVPCPHCNTYFDLNIIPDNSDLQVEYKLEAVVDNEEDDYSVEHLENTEIGRDLIKSKLEPIKLCHRYYMEVPVGIPRERSRDYLNAYEWLKLMQN